MRINAASSPFPPAVCTTVRYVKGYVCTKLPPAVWELGNRQNSQNFLPALTRRNRVANLARFKKIPHSVPDLSLRASCRHGHSPCTHHLTREVFVGGTPRPSCVAGILKDILRDSVFVLLQSETAQRTKTTATWHAVLPIVLPSTKSTNSTRTVEYSRSKSICHEQRRGVITFHQPIHIY